MKLATTGAGLLAIRKPASYLHRVLSTTWLDSQRRLVAGQRAVEVSAMDSIEPRPPAFEGAIGIGFGGIALDDFDFGGGPR